MKIPRFMSYMKRWEFRSAARMKSSEARIASRQLKQELFISEDEPIMYRERITYTADNKPIEFSQNSYRALDYKYVVHLNNTR